MIATTRWRDSSLMLPVLLLLMLLLGSSSPAVATASVDEDENAWPSWQAEDSDPAPFQPPASWIFHNGFETGNACAWLGACVPNLRINEINATQTSSCDLVELRVLTGGDLLNYSLFERGVAILTFGSVVVQTGDIVVVHVNAAIGGTCNPDGCPDETTSTSQFPAVSCAENYDTAWDWHSLDAGLVSTDNVLTLYRPGGTIVDAVLLVDSPTQSVVSSASETQAAIVGAAGEWETVTGGLPPGGYVDLAFSTHAVNDLDATGSTPGGNSIQRVDKQDSNDMSDWTTGAGLTSTFGLPNAGQNSH